MGNDESTPGDFGFIIRQRMEDRGISIRDLAIRLDVTYEHARRLVRGEALPSRLLAKMIAEELDLPEEQLTPALTAERVRRKYGPTAMALASKRPGLQRIEQLWDQLSPEHQGDLVVLAERWARRGKGSVGTLFESNEGTRGA